MDCTENITMKLSPKSQVFSREGTSQQNHKYLGGLCSRKFWTWDKEGLNKASLAAKASSKGTEPPIALRKFKT